MAVVVIKKICFENWRQFSNVNIEFHKHLTVLTGANGAGKTSILNLLSRCTGWQPVFVSSFSRDSNGLGIYSNSLSAVFQESLTLNSMSSYTRKFGEIEFSDGTVGSLEVPINPKDGTYSVEIRSGTRIKGVYINSHRPTFPYRPVKSIPTTIDTRAAIYSKYNEFSKSYVFDTYRNSNELSATSLIKETLAALAVFGYGNSSVKPNLNAKELFEGYVNILKTVLPPKLGFKAISVVVPEVMLCTKTGEFPIDAVSGGISSIINMTWQLYMFADPKEPFIALIDEPENHLHPELQKSFLGNLIQAFPNVQFVVATHNPFMISAVKDSNVYVLNYNLEHKVYSRQLDYVNRAGTSNAILREVLGIDSSMPFWAEKSIKEIIEKYSSTEFSEENLLKFRSEMDQLGLGDFIPETIARVAEGKLYD